MADFTQSEDHAARFAAIGCDSYVSCVVVWLCVAVGLGLGRAPSVLAIRCGVPVLSLSHLMPALILVRIPLIFSQLEHGDDRRPRLQGHRRRHRQGQGHQERQALHHHRQDHHRQGHPRGTHTTFHAHTHTHTHLAIARGPLARAGPCFGSLMRPCPGPVRGFPCRGVYPSPAHPIRSVPRAPVLYRTGRGHERRARRGRRAVPEDGPRQPGPAGERAVARRPGDQVLLRCPQGRARTRGSGGCLEGLAMSHVPRAPLTPPLLHRLLVCLPACLPACVLCRFVDASRPS